jgi:dynein light intermediate chain 1
VFGLGYTFFDFKDAESGDKLSHLDVYTLDSYEDRCLPMLRPVLQRAKGNVLVAIVLDWDHVDAWADQLWAWMGFVRRAVDFDCVEELRQRIQRYGSEGHREVELPLEPGQYEDPLGVDFVTCAIGSESVVDGEGAFSDETVDFAQQFLRAVAWRCGGSMVCLPYSLDVAFDGLRDVVSERLRLPMHSDVAAHAEPRVVDPDRVVIPSGWDSHGKIAALREESMDVVDQLAALWTESDVSKAIALYRTNVDVDADALPDEAPPETRPVPRTDFQDFLAKQHEVLEKKLAEEPKENVANTAPALGDYNVGGIQVENMDEVLRRLKARDVANSSSNNAPSTPDRRSDRSESTTPNNQNEVLANFFQNLLERRRNSPGANNSPG